MNFLKNTPIMIVESINPTLPFWIENLGFTKSAVFPEEGTPAFAMLTKGDKEVMFQTAESSTKEHPILKPYVSAGTIIQYIDVDSLDAVLSKIAKESILVPPKETFYGTREAVIKTPSGLLLIFAEKKVNP